MKMNEQVTLKPIAVKRALQFAADSGINEVFVYEDESGKNFVTNPAPSVALDDDLHPVYHTPKGVYIRVATLNTLLINNRTVRLSQNADSVLVELVKCLT